VFVVAGEDGGVRMWSLHGTKSDAAEAKFENVFRHGSTVFHASFSPDGLLLVTTSRDRTARVWDLATGDLVVPPLYHSTTVNWASFNKGGTKVVTAGRDIRVWSLETGNPRPEDLETKGQPNYIGCSEDGSWVFLKETVRNEEVIRAWKISDGLAKLQNLPGKLAKQAAQISCAAVSPKGDRLVVARTLSKAAKRSGPEVETVLESWDWTTGPAKELLQVDGPINFVAFSPGGRYLVFAGKNTDATGYAQVWDLLNERCQGKMLTHFEMIKHAAFGSTGPAADPDQLDSLRLVTASVDDTAQVWQVKDSSRVGKLLRHTADVLHAAFDSTGKYVVTSSADLSATVWDVEQAKKVRTLSHPNQVKQARFSPDGWQHVVTAGSDGATRVWHLVESQPSKGKETQQPENVAELVALLRQGGNVDFAAFVDAGKAVVTVGHSSLLLSDENSKVPVQVRKWYLAAEKETDANWIDLLSARRVERGNLEPLDPKELVEMWKKQQGGR
jgi:WD40 repeat protein